MKITMIHELDVGFFASTMRKAFEKLGHEVCVVQGFQTYLEEETNIDYSFGSLQDNVLKIELGPENIYNKNLEKTLQETDFFILRFLSDAVLKTLDVTKYANSSNAIYKVHGSELRDRLIPYSLMTWHLDWYQDQPTVCGPRDWSLMDKYQSNVVTHIERPLDFDIIPKKKSSHDCEYAISTPTNTYKKGTALLEEAWKHCPEHFPLKIIKGVSRRECLQEKAGSSLYIDRLGDYEHGPYGMNSAEAWYMKIPVFSQVRNWDRVFCADLENLVTPIDQFTIVEKVKEFLENEKIFKKQTAFAYDYVKKVHNPITIAKQYIALAEEINRR